MPGSKPYSAPDASGASLRQKAIAAAKPSPEKSKPKPAAGNPQSQPAQMEKPEPEQSQPAPTAVKPDPAAQQKAALFGFSPKPPVVPPTQSKPVPVPMVLPTFQRQLEMVREDVPLLPPPLPEMSPEEVAAFLLQYQRPTRQTKRLY